MAAAQHRRTMPPTERDDQSQGTRIQRLVRGFVRYDNDNLERAGAVDELAKFKRPTWGIFCAG